MRGYVYGYQVCCGTGNMCGYVYGYRVCCGTGNMWLYNVAACVQIQINDLWDTKCLEMQCFGMVQNWPIKHAVLHNTW